jgi:hypothetical protein
MRSSGVGNHINMLSLIYRGRFPFLALVSMRGDFGEADSDYLSRSLASSIRRNKHGSSHSSTLSHFPEDTC